MSSAGLYAIEFSLRCPNTLPVGDYGVRAAVQKLYGIPDMPKPR